MKKCFFLFCSSRKGKGVVAGGRRGERLERPDSGDDEYLCREALSAAARSPEGDEEVVASGSRRCGG